MEAISITKPSFSEKFTKGINWRLGITLFTGKILGLLVILAAMKVLPGMLATPA